MVELNLIPRVPIVVMHGAIFLVNLAIVKRYFVTPYLRLASARQAMTGERKKQAEALLAKCQGKSAMIDQALQQAAQLAREIKERASVNATAEYQKLLEAAREDAASLVNTAKIDLEKALQRERISLPETVNRVSKEVYQNVVGTAH